MTQKKTGKPKQPRRPPRLLKYWFKKPINQIQLLVHDSQPRAVIRLQRHKKSELSMEALRLRTRNPDKVVFTREGRWPFCLEVFSYWKNRKRRQKHRWVLIAAGQNYISLHADEVDTVIQGLQRFKEWLNLK